MSGVVLLFFPLVSWGVLSPPERMVFHKSGVFEGGDTRNLNLEKISLLKKNELERIDFSFSAGSRKIPSPRLPPYQLRLETRPGNPFGRVVLLLQGIAGRNVPRLVLDRLSMESNLVDVFRIHSPIEDGDTVVELVLKANVEFKEVAKRGVLELFLLPGSSAPLGKPAGAN